MKLVELVQAKMVFGEGSQAAETIDVAPGDLLFVLPTYIAIVNDADGPDKFPTTTTVKFVDGVSLLVLGSVGEIVKQINMALK